MLRTHYCGKLRSQDLGKRVTMAGWVRFRRDHGGVLFLDLAGLERHHAVGVRPRRASVVRPTKDASRSCSIPSDASA